MVVTDFNDSNDIFNNICILLLQESQMKSHFYDNEIENSKRTSNVSLASKQSKVSYI